MGPSLSLYLHTYIYIILASLSLSPDAEPPTLSRFTLKGGSSPFYIICRFFWGVFFFWRWCFVWWLLGGGFGFVGGLRGAGAGDKGEGEEGRSGGTVNRA